MKTLYVAYIAVLPAADMVARAIVDAPMPKTELDMMELEAAIKGRLKQDGHEVRGICILSITELDRGAP